MYESIYHCITLMSVSTAYSCADNLSHTHTHSLPVSFPLSHTYAHCSIVIDLVLNKRIPLSDREALKDAQRSLGVMLADFLKHKSMKYVTIYERW